MTEWESDRIGYAYTLYRPEWLDCTIQFEHKVLKAKNANVSLEMRKQHELEGRARIESPEDEIVKASTNNKIPKPPTPLRSNQPRASNYLLATMRTLNFAGDSQRISSFSDVGRSNLSLYVGIFYSG